MSKKQEYIAKIRYRNDLPPPLLPPKLLKFTGPKNEEAVSPQLISSLYARTNVTPLIGLNADLSLSVDLTRIPGVLNSRDTKNLYGFENIKVHPEDRVLLRDPRVDRLTKTDVSKVSFLRRTEYVTTTSAAKSSSRKRPVAELEEQPEDEIMSPEQILKRVETTFDAASQDLAKIQHPTKKKVHAVNRWSVLPDTAAMDQTYFTIRMIGSAALDGTEKQNLALSTALFRPVELEEDEWVSLYTTDKAASDAYDANREQAIDELAEDDRVYKFKRLRDFEMKQLLPPAGSSPFSELALRFNNDKKVVYYKSLRSRIELRRRRVNDAIKPLVAEHNLDQINVKLSNPLTEETRLRDRIRMKFDPIDFPNIEDEEEDETKQNDATGSRDTSETKSVSPESQETSEQPKENSSNTEVE
ncbi:LAMI_0H10836g1_1 [Lachancea mirantina]|uniref:LAMI_0H10836g1_1 n=1 Tax=Lachancea mirantina TaxID=1230905 RepID=A0A1G4KGZ6_9SACH|nr:LAMI_0H10836g1_1 [Lachancea mirantina]